MKILITTDLFTTKTNGVVTSTKNLIHELTEGGHDVRVLTFSKTGKSYKEDNVYYVKSMSLEWIYPEIRKPTSRAGKFVREIVEWRPDVIHSQCEYFSFGFAKRISKKSGAPIVHTYHTLYEQYVGYVVPFKRFGRWVVRNLITRRRLRKVETIIAPTGKVRDVLRSYGVKNDIAVVPSGISLDRHKIRFSVEEREARRREYGISADNFVLINLGRLGTEKNIDELIRYFSALREGYESLRLLIVGGGPAKESLEKLAKELSVGDRVIFTGMVKPEEVALYYQLADLFVSASTSETQGLTYVEAAANGLCELCRDDPCIDEVVIDGENGYRYTDFDSFKAGLDKILSSEQWRKSASEISEKISSRYDRRVFGESAIAVYESAIEKHNQKKK